MMGKKGTIGRTVFIFVLLHTAVIIMLVLVLFRTELLSKSPLLAAAVITGSAVFVLYTTRMIVKNISGMIAQREKTLSQISINMQTALATMGEYAKELERRAEILNECGADIAQCAGVVAENNDMICKLAEAAISSISDKSGVSGISSDRKAG